MKGKNVNGPIKISKMVLLVTFFLFLVIILRVTQLALSKEIDGINLQDFASKRTTYKETLSAKRGTIYDRNGEILAQNVSSYTLIARLDEKITENSSNPQHVVDKEMTAEKLSSIIGLDKSKIMEYLSKENVYQTEFGLAGKGLTEIEKDEIMALDLPGIDFIETQKRYYPNQTFASYAIGYAKTLEDGSIVGEMGIEKYYNDVLSGVDGFIEYQKDLKGCKIPNTHEVMQEAIDGKDIYLTIDSNIQFFIEQALANSKENYNYEWLTMVVADAKTGEILGSSSSPSFDPNIRDMTNYIDLNVGNAYEPGSTMKIFTYMATLESGKYNGSDTYLSGTYVTEDGTEIGDWDRAGWGYLTYDKGFVYSSNVGVVNLIKEHLSRQTLKSYFSRLGFGSKTGIELPLENKGKIAFRYETEVLNAGFGQGILTTPMQNIQALTSLTNNGTIIKPYIVTKIMADNKVSYEGEKKELRVVASSETVNKILELMDQTINGEDNITGYNYHIDNYSLIGKTGTAQIADGDGKGYLSGDQVISSFAGIYPKDNPSIIIYASLYKAESAATGAITSAVKSVVVNTSKYLGLEKTLDNEEIINNYKMESLINKNIDVVKNNLDEHGISYLVLGSGNRIINQYPSSGVLVTSKDKILLLTDGQNLVMPNLTGWSSNQAITFLNFMGISYKIEGNGYVINQSLSEGSMIDKSQAITLTLEPKYQKTN